MLAEKSQLSIHFMGFSVVVMSEFEYLEKLIVCESMPAIIKEAIAYGVSQYGDTLPQLLKDRVNQVAYSINDIECSYWDKFHGVENVVELSHLFVEKDFFVIRLVDFCTVIEALCSGQSVELGQSLFVDPRVRTDYEVAKDYW